MKSVMMFLAFSCFCLEVCHVCCICPDDKYTIVSSNGSTCLHCAKCHHGQGLYPPCGSSLKKEEISKITCRDCPSGSFSDEYDPSPCKACQQCALHEIASANCTKVSDTSCNKTCVKGYFFVEVSHSCQQCSFCCFDKNDEPQPECIKQGFKATGQYCSIRSDKNCAPVHPTTGTAIQTIVTNEMHYQNKSTPSATSAVVPGYNTKGSTQNNTTIIIVLGVLASVLAFAAPIVGFLCWRKRMKEQRRMAGINDSNPSTTVQIDTSYANQGPTQSNSSAVVPLASPNVKSLQINAGYTPSSPEESPCPTDDELGELSNPKNELRKKRILKRQSSKAAQASKDSASKSFLGSGEEGYDESKVQDKNGVSPALDRRSSVVETAIRKMSRDISYQPLPGEDSDEPDEPDEPDGNAQKGERRFSEPVVSFKALKKKLSGASTTKKEIMQAEVLPRHQEQKEGSRVEFKCNISGETEARYQWFKDDAMMQGRRNSSLVLDPVKVEDFGNYKCEVKYDDADSVKCVTSLPAELDIVPREGMERKCLRDVDLDIQEMVGNLLTQKKPGYRTWKQLAIKYSMQKDHIVSLENNQEKAGKEVIEYLAMTYPNLTVYEICQKLKNKDIRRFDIVEVLLPHLSAPISGRDVSV